MSAPPMVPFSHSVLRDLETADCEATLRRACYGHLSFLRGEHVDVLPSRFAFIDNWVYFRANAALGDTIFHNRWMVLSVTERREHSSVASVVVRGCCHGTGDTGSVAGDRAALEGIMALRERPGSGLAEESEEERTLHVFRLHADEISGSLTFVP